MPGVGHVPPAQGGRSAPAEEVDPPECAANVESCIVTFSPSQDGHAGEAESCDRINFSNFVPHPSHLYS